MLALQYSNDGAAATCRGVAAVEEEEAFPHCEEKVRWMRMYWDSVWGDEAAYRAQGVDGSEASIRQYLGDVEDWCPPTEAFGAEQTSVAQETTESCNQALQ